MTLKTFSSKSNAVRDARKALGPEALPGTDFHLLPQADGSFGWASGPRVAAPEAAEVLANAKKAAAGKLTAMGASNIVPLKAANPEPDAPPAPVKAPKVAKTPAPAREAEPAEAKARTGKASTLVEMAKRAEGVTTEEVMTITGWTKIGGFHGAVQRSGLTLVRRRELKETRWFAVDTDQTPCPVFARQETGGQWAMIGRAETAAEALALAGGIDMATELGEGREAGVIFVAPRAAVESPKGKRGGAAQAEAEAF